MWGEGADPEIDQPPPLPVLTCSSRWRERGSAPGNERETKTKIAYFFGAFFKFEFQKHGYVKMEKQKIFQIGNTEIFSELQFQAAVGGLDLEPK